MVNVHGSTAVVTGGQRGLGKALVDELIKRGAFQVFATARCNPKSNDQRVVSVALDVMSAKSTAALAEAASDATIVFNNAGISGGRPSLLKSEFRDIRAVFETNYFGALRVAARLRRYWPVTVAGPSSTSTRCCPGSPAKARTATPRPRSGRRPTRCGWRWSTEDLGDRSPRRLHRHRHGEVTRRPEDRCPQVAAAILDGIEDGQTEVLVDDSLAGSKPPSRVRSKDCNCVERYAFDAHRFLVGR